jgi:hypothetical protein
MKPLIHLELNGPQKNDETHRQCLLPCIAFSPNDQNLLHFATGVHHLRGFQHLFFSGPILLKSLPLGRLYVHRVCYITRLIPHLQSRPLELQITLHSGSETLHTQWNSNIFELYI